MIPFVRSQKMIEDLAALRTHRVESPRVVEPAPPTPKRDLIAEAADSIEQFVEVQDAHSATLLESTSEGTRRAVEERAVESVLRELATKHPGLSNEEVAALRERLQERA